MFFFFFGGVQPEVTKVIENNVTLCPRCGEDANLVEYDNVFRAFFMPVWRWAGSNPAVSCRSCSFLLPLEQFQKLYTPARNAPVPTYSAETRGKQAQDIRPKAPLLRCWSCRQALQPEFQYCPQCGAAQ